MDDLDRLFALVDLVSDPKTAKKNADEMKTLQAQKRENTQLLKEVNTLKFEVNKDKERLKLGWAEINDARASIDNAKADLESERKAVEKMRRDATDDIARKRGDLKAVEDAHARKVSELEGNRKTLEAAIVEARQRKETIEGELEVIRQKVS